MKTCPFCAEEVQDAAIVCKHCRRDLVATMAKPRAGRITLIVGAVLALPFAMLYCGPDHQRFIKFSAQRDAWHLKYHALGHSARGCGRIRATESELGSSRRTGTPRRLSVPSHKSAYASAGAPPPFQRHLRAACASPPTSRSDVAADA